MQKNKKLLLTGGHAATPALATIMELKKRNWEGLIYWIGPYSAMEGEKVTTAAQKALSAHGVKVIRIVAGRAKKRGSIPSILSAYIKIPIGFVHGFYYLLKLRPSVVLSFGGFASLPVTFAAAILRVPVIIQEQIVGAGLANKLAAPLAKKILVSRRESLEFFPKQKTILIGNPQVSEIFNIPHKKKMGSTPTIYITGGSSGSEIINNTVWEILPTLLQNYNVIHQVGDRNLSDFMERKKGLVKKFTDRYEVFGYVLPTKVHKFFERADIIISRAGANTVSDIVASRRPAILIPIPWSISDEQNKNAVKAAHTGIALILNQDALTPRLLLGKIEEVRTNWDKMTKNVRIGDFSLDPYAASKIVDEISKYL